MKSSLLRSVLNIVESSVKFEGRFKFRPRVCPKEGLRDRAGSTWHVLAHDQPNVNQDIDFNISFLKQTMSPRDRQCHPTMGPTLFSGPPSGE